MLSERNQTFVFEIQNLLLPIKRHKKLSKCLIKNTAMIHW